MNKLCDDLVGYKLSVDDIIQMEEKVVSSTESTSVKRHKSQANGNPKPPPKKQKPAAKSLAKPRPKSKPKLPAKKHKSQSEILNDMSRARELFGGESSCSSSEDSVAIKLQAALKEIAELKKLANVSHNDEWTLYLECWGCMFELVQSLRRRNS